MADALVHAAHQVRVLCSDPAQTLEASSAGAGIEVHTARPGREHADAAVTGCDTVIVVDPTLTGAASKSADATTAHLAAVIQSTVARGEARRLIAVVRDGDG